MNADEYREALDVLGWHNRHVARALGIHYTTPQRWASGDEPVPRAIARWLTRLTGAVALAYELNPPPTGDWSV
jgi:hypothetical protein